MRPLPLFAASPHCTGGAHCRACRDREGGRAFRASLANAFQVPDGGPDFECPHGKAWDHRPPPMRIPARIGGVGTELRKLLASIGLEDVPGCSCKMRSVEMDARGVEWCEANVDVIVGWMRAEAGRQGVPFVGLVARGLVGRAIRNANPNP